MPGNLISAVETLERYEARARSETKSDGGEAPTPPARPRRYRPRRTVSDRVREALMKLAKKRGSLLTHEESAWNSITFSGTRHIVRLKFEGTEAVEAGETFIAELPDHEFAIPGQLVAEAIIREVDHRFGRHEQMVVTAVLLLLEES